MAKLFRPLVVVAAILTAQSALAAAVTWTTLSGTSRSAAGVCAAGNTCDAPTGTTAGAPITDVTTLEVYVCADSGQTITDGAGFDVWFYDSLVGLWAKWNSTPYTVPTGARCGYLQGDSPAKGIPILGRRGRVAVVPNSAAVSSGALTMYVILSNAIGSAP